MREIALTWSLCSGVCFLRQRALIDWIRLASTACEFWTDTAQGVFELRYVRNKDQREVDFLVLRNKEPWYLFECKSQETKGGTDLLRYQSLICAPHAVQLVHVKGFDRVDKTSGVRVVDYARFFSGWV